MTQANNQTTAKFSPELPVDEYPTPQECEFTESPASRASECDQVIDSVKKAIGAAELSDHLNADLKEALVQALKRELAELEQLDPDAPLNPSALGAPAQHMISIFEGHSL